MFVLLVRPKVRAVASRDNHTRLLDRTEVRPIMDAHGGGRHVTRNGGDDGGHNMLGRIDFEKDAANNIIIARPHWLIETEADCAAWAQQYVDYFEGLGSGKVDVVFVLDDFKVAPPIGAVWGEHRARIVNKY